MSANTTHSCRVRTADTLRSAQPTYNECVCVLLVQGAPLMNKAGMLTEEGIIQQSSIYVHPIQCLLHKKRRYLTENDKLKNRCTLVTNVGSVIHLRAACIGI